ncbi:hypothetical protein CHS0354_028692 [Potamilus streckersoni]|uniref:Uncharacterized protein n=1 Tax=Potamilus streckersoni TaxID=2493646 RepID=A0AAE0VHC6_9BIVA|nr:hypothetical protein CHS0354_028692 [Potamilus streckersoni]
MEPQIANIPIFNLPQGGNLIEDRIHHLLSSESDLKDYFANDPTEACIKTLLSEASKLSNKQAMQIILHLIVLRFKERFIDRPIQICVGEEVIGPGNVQTVLVCFFSGSCDRLMETFYDLKVIDRDYNATDGESARVRELDIKSDLTIEHCDLVNKAITFHGESLDIKSELTIEHCDLVNKAITFHEENLDIKSDLTIEHCDLVNKAITFHGESLDIKSDLTIEHCDLVNKAITFHGESLDIK